MLRRIVLTVSIVFLGILSAGNDTAAQTTLTLPNGFHATVYASGLAQPTAMSFGPDGRLYVAENGGEIVSVGGGRVRTVATGYSVPLGLSWHAGKLYVSYTGSIAVLTPSRNFSSFSARVIVRGLPTGKHQNDGMAFQGKWLYVGIGSTCNACVEADRRSASIMRFHLDGSRGQIVARGLRNPYSLAFRPGSGQLYATDNGRDDYDDSVPDELNRIVMGGNYGWPNCWGKGGGSGCRGTIAPVALFEPHASADGLVFYTGKTFPARYRGDAFVAEYGRTVGVGYQGHRVKDVHFVGNRAVVSDFATGLRNPLAIVLARDGSLLVADWGTSIIWRIQANGH